ncbi:MAG: EamA family transporter [Ferruginibacter sp.]
METKQLTKQASTTMVALAFATVYLAWGSTYFFIQKALQGIPPFLMGAIRFAASGLILLGWCLYKKEDIWNPKIIKPAVITGLLLLFVGNGAVIWVEQELPSSLVAIFVSAAPLWFVVLDKPKWKENFGNRSIIISLVIGFAGVLLLFSQKVSEAFSSGGGGAKLIALIAIILGCISWVAGSLYSKYNGTGSATANTMWQMLAASLAFFIISAGGNELKTFQWQAVSSEAWWSVIYLITMGSLAGYSAYVWLLQVRPATQVSTYAYVNPVVAVLLGVFFAGEQLVLLQGVGLAIILFSVLLINLSKQRKEKQEKQKSVQSMISREVNIKQAEKTKEKELLQ